MKKNGLFLFVALLSVFCFTSCIESDNVSDGVAIGVLNYSDDYITPVLKSTFGPPLSASNLGTLISNGDMNINNCYYFEWRLDMDLPENAQNVAAAKGYYTVTLGRIYDIPKYSILPYLADTSQVLPDEIAVLSAYEGEGVYLEGYLFIDQTIIQSSDLDVEWNMSFDYATMMPFEGSDGKRYYDVFVRATKKNNSEKPTVTMQHLNAYNMGGYLRSAAYEERNFLGTGYSESSSTFALRFNFVSEIDKDTEAITWKSITKTISIADFLEE